VRKAFSVDELTLSFPMYEKKIFNLKQKFIKHHFHLPLFNWSCLRFSRTLL
jgi:hypothetical protein